jgi:hypothetical protein
MRQPAATLRCLAVSQKERLKVYYIFPFDLFPCLIGGSMQASRLDFAQR